MLHSQPQKQHNTNNISATEQQAISPVTVKHSVTRHALRFFRQVRPGLSGKSAPKISQKRSLSSPRRGAFHIGGKMCCVWPASKDPITESWFTTADKKQRVECKLNWQQGLCDCFALVLATALPLVGYYLYEVAVGLIMFAKILMWSGIVITLLCFFLYRLFKNYTCLWDASTEDYLKRDKRQLAMKNACTRIPNIHAKKLRLILADGIFTSVEIREVHSIAVISGLNGLPQNNTSSAPKYNWLYRVTRMVGHIKKILSK